MHIILIMVNRFLVIIITSFLIKHKCIFKCIGSFNFNKWQNRRAFQTPSNFLYTCYLITTTLFSNWLQSASRSAVFVVGYTSCYSFLCSHTNGRCVNFPLNNPQTVMKQYEWKMHLEHANAIRCHVIHFESITFAFYSSVFGQYMRENGNAHAVTHFTYSLTNE